jgi:hypothetical protein
MHTVQIRLEATSKDLNFLSDPELAETIRTILAEIDNLVIINAHRSMVYLSMSTLEGILSNILSLNINKIKTFPSYPKKKGGGLQRYDKVELVDKIKMAKDLGIIAPEFFDTFEKFKEFRNYMHPLREVKNKEPLDIGLGQVALGLMNHTISKLEKIRFIEEKIWRVLSGIPVYTAGQKQIDFKAFYPIPTHSFLVTEDYAGKNLEVSFDLHMGDYHVFNFVFNYGDEQKYHMLRFETRKNEFCGVLHCDHKYAWRLVDEYNEKWDIKTAEPNRVRIRIDSGNLKIYLNGNEQLQGKQISWDNQKSIGFFNEVESVYISNLSVNII